MLNTQSIGLLVSGVAISGFGIFSQQPLLTGAGAGVAGSIGSANLVGSRRKDQERIASECERAIESKRIQALESAIGNLTDLVKLNNTTITDTQSTIDRLQSTSKIQSTHLNLLTKGHQQLQQLNHSQRSAIANQATALSDKDRELADLKSELDRVYSLVDENQPASNPVVATRQPVTHLLIDGNAMRFIEKEFGNIDYQILKDKLTQGATKVKCNFYLSQTGKPAQKEFVTELKKIGFKIFFFPIVNYTDGTQKTKGDDVQIAIDAVNAAPGDRVIICGGGDSDFFPVVNQLKAKGIDFTIVAHKKTLGDRLRRAAGKNLIYFSAIDGIKLS
jgi:uncharacterized LabA/DUF88 family protein